MDRPATIEYHFGRFRLEPAEHRLWRDGDVVPLPPKAFEMLVALVENGGHLLTKDELLRRIWPGVVVEENNLSVTMSGLRRTLGDGADDARYVETVPRRGYRFIAPVRESRVEERPERIESVAVLPFRSRDAPSDYFAEGLSERLINLLARQPALRVSAYSTVRRFAGSPRAPASIGREIGVQAVCTGRVEEHAERIIMHVELVRSGDGSRLWGTSLEREPGAIFDLHEELVGALCGAMARAGIVATSPRPPTENVDAYREYLRGHHLWGRWNPPAILRSIQCFERATTLDPGYALAHAELSNAWAALSFVSAAAARDVMPKAEAAARRALEIDPDLAEAHLYLGDVLAYFHCDWSGAERAYRRSLELAPDSAQGLRMLGVFLVRRGRLLEALAAGRRALELEPVSATVAAELAETYYYLGRYEDAIAECQRALELNPDAMGTLYWLFVSLERSGHHAAAVAAYLAVLEQYGVPEAERRRYKEVYARDGWVAFWRERIATRLAQAATGYVSSYRIAEMHARVGDPEAACTWLERAWQDRDALWLSVLPFDPTWSELRDDPRVRHLIAQMRLT